VQGKKATLIKLLRFGTIIHGLESWYKNKKISEKLIVGFILVAIFGSVSVGTAGVVNLVRIDNISNQIYNENLIPLTPLYNISTNFLKLQTEMRDIALGKEREVSEE
jgi:methyl-accepting chemotaxis protein